MTKKSDLRRQLAARGKSIRGIYQALRNERVKSDKLEASNRILKEQLDALVGDDLNAAEKRRQEEDKHISKLVDAQTHDWLHHGNVRTGLTMTSDLSDAEYDKRLDSTIERRRQSNLTPEQKYAEGLISTADYWRLSGKSPGVADAPPMPEGACIDCDRHGVCVCDVDRDDPFERMAETTNDILDSLPYVEAPGPYVYPGSGLNRQTISGLDLAAPNQDRSVVPDGPERHDYSDIEARAFAHQHVTAHERSLREGVKPMKAVTLDDVIAYRNEPGIDKEERQKRKVETFGWLYGGQLPPTTLGKLVESSREPTSFQRAYATIMGGAVQDAPRSVEEMDRRRASQREIVVEVKVDTREAVESINRLREQLKDYAAEAEKVLPPAADNPCVEIELPGEAPYFCRDRFQPRQEGDYVVIPLADGSFDKFDWPFALSFDFADWLYRRTIVRVSKYIDDATGVPSAIFHCDSGETYALDGFRINAHIGELVWDFDGSSESILSLTHSVDGAVFDIHEHLRSLHGVFQ